jgi:hypothetical protein
MLQRINYEVFALVPTLLKLHSTGVYHYPNVPEQGKPLSESTLVKSIESTMDFTRKDYTRPIIAGRFLIGEFRDGQDRPYLMIVNKDLQHGFRFRLQTKQPVAKMYMISSWSGEEKVMATDMNWIAPGSGMLLRLE